MYKTIQYQQAYLRRRARGNVLLVTLIFLGIFVTSGTALLSYLTTYARSERIQVASTQARMLAEAGIDKAIHELNQRSDYYDYDYYENETSYDYGYYDNRTNTTLGAGTFSITVSTIDSVTKQITATGYVPNRTSPVSRKTIQVLVKKGRLWITFRYGTQAGQGGIYFSNNSALEGNLYSNGNIVGSNGAYITGYTHVAGSAGSISGMSCLGGVASGSSCSSSWTPHNAYAHTITNSKVTGTLYCQVGSGNSQLCNKSLPDPLPLAMPISDDTIAQWKSGAVAGTTITGDYNISSGSVTLGPTKIIGNMTVSGTATVTLANTVWVTGNVSFSGAGGGSQVKLASAFGSQSGILVADGQISIGNNVSFQDSGTSGSYIMLLSTSSCDESTTGSPCIGKNAIEISNNANIIIANAQRGTVTFSNNAAVKEVVGKTIRLKNGAIIRYGSGLPWTRTFFQSGSDSSWAFVPGTYTISP